MPTPDAAVRFHLSLNVSNLDIAVPFFEKLLGTTAAKRRSDYAKFELQSPPLVLSLEPRSPQDYGSLNHVGFRFSDAKTLVDLQKQLETMGIKTEREEGVECCYAKQTKFWVNDADQRLWEFYVLEGDLDHRGEGQPLEKMIGANAACNLLQQSEQKRLPIVWEHRMGSPVEFPAESCHEIRLRGTFNLPEPAKKITDILQRAFNALVPGGIISLHMLTSEEELGEPPNLQGPAAYVKYVPVRLELMQALEEAGFEDLQLTTFRTAACLEFQGHALRETKIEAVRPLLHWSNTSFSDAGFDRNPDDVAAPKGSRRILFKGPFKQICDDAGTQWVRGVPMLISGDRWASIQRSSVGNLFVEIPTELSLASCGN